VRAILGAASGALLAGSAALAGEGGLSNYQPGAYGDFGLALPDAPGLQGALTAFHTTLQGVIEDPGTGAPADVKLTATSAVATLSWTSRRFAGGLTFAAGVTAPLLHVDARARLDFGPFGSLRVADSETGIGDISINPITIYGGDGPFYWSLAENVTLPTGRFRQDRIASPGRNHWSFDTVASFSWLDWAAGFEVAAAAGVIANTSNRATDYRTGAEAHVDANLNLLLAPGLAIGATLYGLAALERDRGAGAGADPPKPRAVGAGLQAIWTPDPSDFMPNLRLKWLHDISTRDRLKGDAFFLIVEVPLN